MRADSGGASGSVRHGRRTISHAAMPSAGTAVTLMRDSGDAEVMQLADQLVRVSQNIEGTASALIVPAVGMAAWLIALRPWRTEPDAPRLSARIS